MPELSFRKICPRSDSEYWTHPSAVWAERSCLALQLYIGRPHPAQAQQWQAVLDRSAALEIPAWLEELAGRGAVRLNDPDVTLLFPGQHFGSLSEVKAALSLASTPSSGPSQLGTFIT